jgi:hypothetical protein
MTIRTYLKQVPVCDDHWNGISGYTVPAFCMAPANSRREVFQYHRSAGSAVPSVSRST